MRGMRKPSQSESAWEVSTAVSSRESGYHSGSWPINGHSQNQLQSEEEERVGVPLVWPDRPQTQDYQVWSDQLYTKQGEEEAGETKLDLLDFLILEDVKERLQQQTRSDSVLAKPRWKGPEQSSQVDLDTFIQNNVPLVFPGQVQSDQSVSFASLRC